MVVAPRDKVFISYSHKDAAWLKKLRTMLSPLERSGALLLWDDTTISPGAKWRDKIRQALESARAAVLLVSDNFLASDFIMRLELPSFLLAAQREGVQLFPILISECLYDRTALKDFQFAHDPKTPLDAMSRSKQKQVLAEIARQLDDLQNRGSGERFSPSTSVVAVPRHADTLRLPLTDYTLFGRAEELRQLQTAWDNAKVNVVTVVAFGGTGKTALINHWLQNLRDADWGGTQRVFGWSFFNQGSQEDKQVSSELFIAEAMRFFGVADPGPISAWEKGRLLADAIQRQRTLLVLDGAEPLQEPPGPRGGHLRDQGLLALLLTLAAENSGLCVVTTRLPIEDLKAVSPRNLLQLDLGELMPKAGAQFLEHLGVRGEQEELEEAVREFGGHALALRLLGNYLAEVYGGDVRRRDSISRLVDEEQQGYHARRVMASYEEWFADKPELQILCLMGLFDRPADQDALAALRQEPAIPGLTDALLPLDEVRWRYALGRLRKVGLITEDDARIDCHPLVRDHFALRLQEKDAAAGREAHARLFDHFRRISGQDLPITLEDLEPLFQAVSHGCRAGRYSDAFSLVYWPLISRGDEAYCTHTLGAVAADLSAILNFFVVPWTKLAPGFDAKNQAWLFNQAGYDLRALGRLSEARQPMEAGLKLGVGAADWKSAARCANNLARICLMLGEVKQSIQHARLAVSYADRGQDRFRALAYRSNLAHALHQAGQLSEAEQLFRELEQLQQNDALSSGTEVRRNQYWDFLLGQSRTDAVKQQSKLSLAHENGRPLDIALDELSYARALLLDWAKERQSDETRGDRAIEETIATYLNRAVKRLREAGRLHEIPRGLLVRASFRRLQGDYAAARRDIGEAIEIARRHGMKLHEIDSHIELAQLALAEGSFQEAREAYEKAVVLIEQTGYSRRDVDLEELNALLIGRLVSRDARHED
jgi:tetratricopeptide (TPR) repeat protein